MWLESRVRMGDLLDSWSCARSFEVSAEWSSKSCGYWWDGACMIRSNPTFMCMVLSCRIPLGWALVLQPSILVDIDSAFKVWILTQIYHINPAKRPSSWPIWACPCIKMTLYVWATYFHTKAHFTLGVEAKGRGKSRDLIGWELKAILKSFRLGVKVNN